MAPPSTRPALQPQGYGAIAVSCCPHAGPAMMALRALCWGSGSNSSYLNGCRMERLSLACPSCCHTTMVYGNDCSMTWFMVVVTLQWSTSMVVVTPQWSMSMVVVTPQWSMVMVATTQQSSMSMFVVTPQWFMVMVAVWSGYHSTAVTAVTL